MAVLILVCFAVYVSNLFEIRDCHEKSVSQY